MKCTFNNLIQYHNDDGLVIESPNGTKFWYVNDLFHRVDGPAIKCLNGDKCWYIMNKPQSYED